MSKTIFEFEKQTEIRMTLVNKEQGHVTVIQPSKVGRTWIYGAFILPATQEETERMGREDKWRRDQYEVHQGARWDLLEQERTYVEMRQSYEDERRKVIYDHDQRARELPSKLTKEWDDAHPRPVNPLTGRDWP